MTVTNDYQTELRHYIGMLDDMRTVTISALRERYRAGGWPRTPVQRYLQRRYFVRLRKEFTRAVAAYTAAFDVPDLTAWLGRRGVCREACTLGHADTLTVHCTRRRGHYPHTAHSAALGRTGETLQWRAGPGSIVRVYPDGTRVRPQEEKECHPHRPV